MQTKSHRKKNLVRLRKMTEKHLGSPRSRRKRVGLKKWTRISQNG
jgi:hypothetical protein